MKLYETDIYNHLVENKRHDDWLARTCVQRAQRDAIEEEIQKLKKAPAFQDQYNEVTKTLRENLKPGNYCFQFTNGAKMYFFKGYK